MIYLTFNDAPTGVYFSQVTDVCHFIERDNHINVKLIAFISVRKFITNRRLIKNNYENSIVLPMFPKHQNWQFNLPVLILLFLFKKKTSVIARGPFASVLALICRQLGLVKKVCYDGRGAYSGELNEYDVVSDIGLKSEIKDIERRSIHESDFRLAVSNKLVKYWKDWFDYSGEKYTVIPCTVRSELQSINLDEQSYFNKRAEFGFNMNDIVLVYSGSVAGWQSLELVDLYLTLLMRINSNIKMLFLADVQLSSLNSFNEFPGRVNKGWVPAADVKNVLSACDYGILIREKSITNLVASPTKFAEYLLSGLPVIVSEELGDFSDFVLSHQCGYIIADSGSLPDLKPVDRSTKNRISSLALTHFSKKAFSNSYKLIIEELAN